MPQVHSNVPIHPRGLAKRFGTVRVVSHIDLDVAPGEALGLLGPNGAGKSTTLSMLMGLSAPDAGEILIFGYRAGSPQALALTGATPQSTGFPEQLTPREILSYAAARYRTPARIDEIAVRCGLEQFVNRRVAGFSGGEIRCVAQAPSAAGPCACRGPSPERRRCASAGFCFDLGRSWTRARSAHQTAGEKKAGGRKPTCV